MGHDEDHCDACDSPMDDHRCKGCASCMGFRDDSSECTGYCDGCAQNRMLELESDNAKLRADIDAAADVKWRSIDTLPEEDKKFMFFKEPWAAWIDNAEDFRAEERTATHWARLPRGPR